MNPENRIQKVVATVTYKLDFVGACPGANTTYHMYPGANTTASWGQYHEWPKPGDDWLLELSVNFWVWFIQPTLVNLLLTMD